MATKSFEATLESTGANGGVFVPIPFNVKEEYGTKGQVKIKATIDGELYRGSLANMGNGYCLGVLKSIREKIGKQVGDKVKITLEKDTEERIVDEPVEMTKALNKNKKAKAIYDSLSYTHRREYAMWISEAKKDETKKKRLEKMIEMLLAM